MPPAITREIVVAVPDEDHLGPKMLALNLRQRAFVTACLDLGRVDNKKAAAMAGYSGNDNTLAVAGHRLAHTLAIQEAMHEEAGRRLNSAKVMAVSELIHLAQNATQEKDKLKAISMILNRTGMHETSEHKVVTRDESKTEEAMIERIQKLAGELGLDPTKLLGNKAPGLPEPIDVEFTEVVDGSTPTEVSADDDLFAPITEGEAHDQS